MEATIFFGRHVNKFKVLSDYTTKSMTDDSLASKAWPMFWFIFVISFEFTQGKRKSPNIFCCRRGNIKKRCPATTSDVIHADLFVH
jgi:hypothetical protein